MRRPDRPPDRESFLRLLEDAEEEFSGIRHLLEVEDPEWPVLFVGDTHGDLESAVRAKELADERGASVVFLGDYVDRGPNQVETLSFVLAWRLVEPERVVILRGNHESPLTNPYYGFLRAVVGLYDKQVYDQATRTFAQLPYAARMGGEVLAIHGGLSRGISGVEEIAGLPKGDLNPDHPVAMQ
ncbi:MAG: metallophosphoesterase, partial [Candidatus Korarchaeota archaeon]|nr:metallophosphoesterase [Candidatus Korarchaeota archaeon]